MESIDVKVLRELRSWRSSGARALLVTVVKTWGSSPRPIGAMMALRDDGYVIGSVSGGCIEDDLIRRFCIGANHFGALSKPTELVRYGVSSEEAHRFGLPCGGTLELLLEIDPHLGALDELMANLESGALVRRTMSCTSGEVSIAVVDEAQDLYFDGMTLSCTIGPEYRMLLIGAGALAEYLSTMALFNGFSVTLCDPRAEYMGAWSMSGVCTVTDMPDDAVIAFAPDRRSCIVALSHDPKLDDLALLEALHSNAFYIGAIGSRRNSANRRERLIEHFGETTESLQSLRGPVGIYIGSKTPAEIAVSVMAEILAIKNGVPLPSEMSISYAKQVGATNQPEYQLESVSSVK